MIETNAPKHYRWDDLAAEPLKGSITRRMITGTSMMIAEVRLAKGDVVPRHAHHNEQITYITAGALHFTLGERGEREVTVRAGEVLVIPPHEPHAAVALEDTIDIDIFSPPREDWLNGTDAYLRGGAPDES
jgi:quercetin dioxygenase-like cupin family protein